MDSRTLADVLKHAAAAISEQREHLSALDNAIGDGDHGHNMAKGFDAVVSTVLANPNADVGKLLQQVGMTLVSTVGGASGPLYGTAFMRMGAQMAGKQEIHLADLPNLLTAAIGGIQQRGKAERGEKTMLDALIPAQEALAAAVSEGLPAAQAMDRAAAAAEEGAAFTKTIRATKGRASYLGDRSIGHPDPGATSCAILLRAVQQKLAGG